jgi:hypothetical protein
MSDLEIIGLDPGPTHSAVLRYRPADRAGHSPVISNRLYAENLDIAWFLRRQAIPVLAIEMIASYGMPVGREVFETCVWIGRFWEVAAAELVVQIYRKDVKLHLCGNVRAKDGNIRQALIDKFGPTGTKKSPGILYGISGDLWAALAVAVTYTEAPTYSRATAGCSHVPHRNPVESLPAGSERSASPRSDDSDPAPP